MGMDNVADTRTALVYEHRRKAVVEPIVSDHGGVGT
jgi:hypothetical protein